MYSPIKHYGFDKPGMKIGVVGLGGLGHMAVKILKAMGVGVHWLRGCYGVWSGGARLGCSWQGRGADCAVA